MVAVGGEWAGSVVSGAVIDYNTEVLISTSVAEGIDRNG